jgi:predicted lipid-binding transport protein (Tim44 family)
VENLWKTQLLRRRYRGAFGACALAALLFLLTPAAALALGGGGVGGFGGGGGGGGGRGFGGGGGFGRGVGIFGGGGSGREASFAVLLVPIALIVVYVLVGTALHWRASRRPQHRRPFSLGLVGEAVRHVVLWPVDTIVERERLGPRTQKVRLAAAEAAEIDSRFAPDIVCSQAEQLFRTVQTAWTANDRDTLAQIVGKDLMVEWTRRLKAFAQSGWTNQIELKGTVHVDYVGLRNAADERSKRAVVRISTRVRDVVVDREGNTVHRINSIKDTHNVCEYWTLSVAGSRWILLSIEQHHEGLHQLSEPILPSPWSDTEALQREATFEQAAAARIDNSQIHEIVGAVLSTSARAAALDLSMVDDRFAPRVLEAEVDYAVGAWAEAIDGEDAPLEAVARPAALQELLYPDDPSKSRRLVVRGPRVRSVEIVELAGQAAPPSMLVALHVKGRRYIEDRTTTTVVSGDRSLQSSFTMRWRLELTDDNNHPWRIAAVQAGHATSEAKEIEPTG